MSTSYRVEQHIIKNNQQLDELTFCSKNLYNQANYRVRQKFIETSKQKDTGEIKNAVYLNYYDMENQIKDIEEYKLLAGKTRQQLLRLLHKNWVSFFRAIKDYMKHPDKYTGKPSLPGYLNKQGRHLLIFTGQNIELNNGLLRLPKTQIHIKTSVSKADLKEVRVIPIGYKNFKVEIVYKKELKDLNLNKSNVAGVDIGLNNLMAVTSNQPELLCCLINGKPLKSINQFYNKMFAEIQATLMVVNDCYMSKRLNRLTRKRKNKIDDYLHKASRELINQCIEFDIGKIVIGHNKGWKQEINIGKRNNQNFVSIPFNRLIQMIQYKAEEVGIEVLITEESYTSKVDHLALESMEHQESYLGKRIKRGLFRSSTGVELNADLNGALGMLRKVNEVSKDFLESLGNRGCALQPVKLRF